MTLDENSKLQTLKVRDGNPRIHERAAGDPRFTAEH
jgi:hypothetical protein